MHFTAIQMIIISKWHSLVISGVIALEILHCMSYNESNELIGRNNTVYFLHYDRTPDTTTSLFTHTQGCLFHSFWGVTSTGHYTSHYNYILRQRLHVRNRIAFMGLIRHLRPDIERGKKPDKREKQPLCRITGPAGGSESETTAAQVNTFFPD